MAGTDQDLTALVDCEDSLRDDRLAPLSTRVSNVEKSEETPGADNQLNPILDGAYI